MMHPASSSRSMALAVLIVFVLAEMIALANPELPLKQRSVFYSKETLAKVRENVEKHPDGKRLERDAINNAAFWKNLSDDELWDLMFGSRISRSWMVWSNGDCPACKKSVPMYTWIMDPQKHRWKTRCPHCKELFPKNDFESYYKSGLDEQSVFDPKRADRKLLFNTEHPDPSDPLHQFGVDDGEGFEQGEKRWRFIGAYLIYGQFKKLVMGGVEALAVAHAYTGDLVYARKAAILLDRVADLYPTFDYAPQGLVYETRNHNGYVSVWHDACEETRELVLGYDRVFEAIRDDKELVAFLSRKADQHKLSNRKTSFEDIQRNIEAGILRDALKNQHKIHSNFPRAQITVATIMAVLGWPENRDEVERYIDAFVKQATAVNGVTGEKGLSGYSAYTISGMAGFLAEFSRMDPQFLSRLLERQPMLKETYRFHMDTFCLDRYYPNTGDCGRYDAPVDRYVGASFVKLTRPTLNPSTYTLFWNFYEATKDPGYVQILFRENKRTLDGLPHDLLADNPMQFRRDVQQVLKEHGAELKVGSVNKESWRLAILRSGQGTNARALWLDYDSGGAHGHFDGMNLGLFAQGLDLLPDLGYPPVQFGGWQSPRARWYLHTAAHNTVVVDGRNQVAGGGRTELWADGEQFRAIRAAAPALIGGGRYERTAVLIDVSEKEFYVFDLFRVRGGADHAKFVHGPVGTLQTTGLNLQPVGDFGAETQMRNFQQDTSNPSGWQATWSAANRHRAIPAEQKISFRYTDFTAGAIPHTAETWAAPPFNSNDPEIWNPSLMIRRRGAAPQASTFVGIFEAYEGHPPVTRMARLSPVSLGEIETGDTDVAVEVVQQNGVRDVILSSDADFRKGERIRVEQGNIVTDARLAWVRFDKKNRMTHAAICGGKHLAIGKHVIESANAITFVEVDFSGRKPKIVRGETDVNVR